MKIIVFSDSHGKYANIKKAVDMHPDAKYLIHSGDGVMDLNTLDNLPQNIFTVNGNHEDGFRGAKNNVRQQCITVCGKKIFLCHGHKHNVNFNLQNLIYAAVEANADIAVYGHTHIKHSEYIPPDKLFVGRSNGLYIFNPGSISMPRDSIYSSFGLIEIHKNGILLSHGTVK